MAEKMEEEKLFMPHDEVTNIAQQAEEIFKKNGNHWDTYFYKVVLAGNVTVIKQTVTYMESNGSTKTLDWLFQRNEFEEIRHAKQKTSKRLCLLRILLFILLTFISVILTPGFYALHILSATFLNRKQRRISANIKLPLAYAAFSQSQEMVLYFLSQGADIVHVDRHGNNLFHYISDLSSVASEQAIQIFCNTVTKINDVDRIKQLLEHDRNSAGLTAVEYAAKFGSPSLLSQILNQPNIMHHTPFSASADHVTFAGGEETLPHASTGGEGAVSDASTRLEVVDVSRYEAGGIADQSTLLNILSDRDVASMNKQDLQIFTDTHFIGKWLILKCKQMLHGILFFQLCDVIITFLMLYVLSTVFVGDHGSSYRQWFMSEISKVQTNEIEAWSENRSSMLTDDAFHNNVKAQQSRVMVKWLTAMKREDPQSVWKLFNATSLDSAAADPEEYADWEWDLSQLENTDPQKVLSYAAGMPDFKDQFENIRMIQLFPKIVVQAAKEITGKKSELFEGVQNIYTHWDKIRLAMNNMSFEDENGDILHPSSYVDFSFLWDVCSIITPEKVENLLNVTPSFAVKVESIGYFDTCLYKLILDAPSKTCQDEFWTRFTVDKSYVGTDDMILFYIICTYIYIFLDVLERCVFLTNSVVYQTSLYDIIFTALGQKVPGSYVRKQLNVLSCLVIVIQFHFHKHLLGMYSRIRSTDEGTIDVNDLFAKENYVTMLFITAIVVRFLMHIHSLRLLPGIGHFIITTFTMATNLLHFSAVFGTVVLIFAVLFHILIDNPECPLEKSQGFVTVIESIFSTFQLTFGHGEMEPFFTSAPVQLTYVLYVIIVGLLLLNLIIAIMSTTAMQIMADPWKEVLWKVEWLDEATSVEYTFSILTLPFRRLRSCGYFSHKRAGYIVKRESDQEYKIYVQCFHCKAMQERSDE